MNIFVRSVWYIFLYLFFALLCSHSVAQSPKELFILASDAQKKGEFIQSEKFLISILEEKENIEIKNLIAVYNQLGIINLSLGRYEKAIEFFRNGENIALQNIKIMRYKLPLLYHNLGIVFKQTGDYKRALEYYHESLLNLSDRKLGKKEEGAAKVTTFNNIGLIYYEQKDYLTAMVYFKKRMSIEKKYDLNGRDIAFYNYANCLRDLGDYKQAELYYKKCYDIRVKELGRNSYKLSNVYMSLGKLKFMINDNQAAVKLYSKALEISKLNFGNKHPNNAEIYETIGDYYSAIKDYKNALTNYQQSLISNSKNFNSTNIDDNPEPETVFSEIQLLRSLKKKAEVFAVIAKEEKKNSVKNLDLCIKTIDKAARVIKNLRQGYISLESKLYVTANEKELYISGIDNSLKLYELTSDKKYLRKAYQFSRISKAAVLLEEINQNQAMLNNIPDSLIQEKNAVLQDIAAFEKLIFDENQNQKPNQELIKQWQSELFGLNRKYEDLLNRLSLNYPIYAELSTKQDLLSLEDIQKKLAENDVLIEYSYSIKDGKGKLYTFVIDQNQINYQVTNIDSTFEKNIDYSRNKMNQSAFAFTGVKEYNQQNQRLFWLYKLLIKPHKVPKHSNIIIVPDEKIAYLSFDALISDYQNETFINYSGLQYLLYDYQFSYAYSSSLLPGETDDDNYSTEVFAFAPTYNSSNQSEIRNSFGELKNANAEIQSVLTHFNGVSFTGDSATKNNFTSNLKHRGIYHLAMHANADKEHHEFSYLAFSGMKDKKQSPLMYNYEISTIPMKASMLVLSACNTGDGDIYSGEGVMSLSRSFILAGIQSVVHGLWRINDESSSLIMDSFYKYLAEGKSKSKALQLAKIDYIQKASPELANPKYWAGLVLMGDQSSLTRNNIYVIYFLGGFIVLLIAAVLFYRFNFSKAD